ncbi:MAG: PP2C family protein-serine/threonine phosphatase [bacterium]|nr:PP2C family protein-serine/threonine phosphatase [bacterium]
MSVQISVVSEQGPCNHMEDYHSFDANFGGKNCIFGGVYDGHSGSGYDGHRVAEYAAKAIPETFLKYLSTPQPIHDILQCRDFSHFVTVAFRKSYEEVSANGSDLVGACVANFFIQEKKLLCANVGDSHIMVMNRNKSKLLTIDHRLTNKDEFKRIVASGGHPDGKYVLSQDGYNGLIPTRTLGDLRYKSIGVISEPSVICHDIQQSDIFLIAGSDGLFDTMNHEEIRALIRTCGTTDEAATILNQAVWKNHGNDNLTIMVLKLN